MTAFRRCLAGVLFVIASMRVMAFEPQVQGSHASLQYLLQVAAGNPVTPMGGEKFLLEAIGRDEAQMYIHGVIDMGETRQWCIYLTNLPPHEVIDEVLTGLRALPPTDKDCNAALAISDFLKVRFPCQKNR